ncbi:ATP-binding protein [Dyadobacter sp. Leaf189]|uniref:ATP-binding protein n=1 Tax=Dyadobacter sp. Leaf189 TaxID=1736295 RepID=UPI0006FF0682|nr:ATP-binding protein [Dyadobacter sp. Leaf189]KQS33767.1 PAS domain-containing sensor histidine kinase [Dyadobacter sp. Leaf189]
MDNSKTYEELLAEVQQLSRQLQESNDTIHAIRTGQVDAIIVNDPEAGDQLYTLKSADHTYRIFIEKMNEGAVTINRDGTVLYCNSMFAEMVGVPLSNVVGSSLESFIAEEFQEAFKNLISNGWKEDMKMELCIQQNDKNIPCQLSVATLDLDGRESLSVIVTDLSFQKHTQKQLKENYKRLEETNLQLEASNHDLQQFASVASHDLQEPLRKILIFSNLLATTYGKEANPEAKIYLEKISASSVRMRNMVNDILKYSRLSSDQINPELFELRELIREIEDDYEILIEEKKVQLVVGALPAIEGNRAQIKQVFQNLISNSIKFADPAATPVIKITHISSDLNRSAPDQSEIPMCCILVEDNGIGFDMQYQEKIFSLFERLNTKESYEGSGIGLSVTKKIIEKHRGQISAESKEGAGARFTILLPFSQRFQV